MTTAALDADQLIGRAQQQTGLENFGDDGLPERLAGVTGQLDRRLLPPVKPVAAEIIAQLLTERLAFFECRRRLPIDDEDVVRPIIVFGEARSGTTMLQMLLGCDPGSRLLEFWEVTRPCPPPGIADTADRRRRSDEEWREILDLIPEWRVSHPYNAMLGRNPPECERLWDFDFRALTPSRWWRVPGIQIPPLKLPRDDVRQFELHRMMLQHLQFKMPERRWVLKGVTHQHRLAALLDAYPDGMFVWIHRDPLQATASRFELQAQIYEGINAGIDRVAFAERTVELCVANFRAAAEEPLAFDPRIHHLLYQDVMADPTGVIQALYEREGLEFTDRFLADMREWTEANPSNRYGRFRYSVDDLGIDVADLEAYLEPYRARFGVPTERPREV